MARIVDKEALIGFVEEAKSYLPAILQGIGDFQADPTGLETLEEAYRYAHTIKGASSMVGLAGLSHIAYYVEESLEELAAGQLAMDKEMAMLLNKIVSQIESYLEGVRNNTLQERPLLAEATRLYRRIHGLPAEEDQQAVEKVLAEVAGYQSSAAGDGAQAGVPTYALEDDERDDTPPEPAAGFSAEDDFYDEDIPPELLEAFFLEAEDHMRNISAQLSELDKDPKRKDLLQDVRRGVHTIKGSAATVGLQTIARLAHRMEDLLDLLYEGALSIDPNIMDLLFSSADALEDLAGGQSETDQTYIQETIQPLYAHYAALLGAESSLTEKLARRIAPLGEEKVIDLSELAASFTPSGEAETPDADAPPGDGDGRAAAGEVVRVPLERLDELVRLAGELVITRTAFEQRMSDMVREVEELQLSLDRLRRVSIRLETEYEVKALGGVRRNGSPVEPERPAAQPMTFETRGFDELELDRYTEFHLLSRELTETASDIKMVGNDLNNLIGDFDGILNRQERLSSELQEKLMRTRMVPLATLATRLHRAARVVARKQGKLVDLTLEGEKIELDKTVLEEMADPLLHLLRNAVDHGVEPPALRQVMGKPERGRIHLRAYHEGNQVIIQISDDGAGLEPDILRAKAISGGFISEADAPQLSDDDLYSLVFLPGFSTASEVSEVSGRGVGLDIVKANVHKLKGSVTLDSQPGQGTTFSIRLPMTLAVTRALLVRAHGETFAVPLGAVTQILRLEREEIERVGQEPVIRVGGRVYPLLRLGEALRLKQAADETLQRLPALILNAGGKQVALLVERLLEGREIVIKTLGSHLRRVHGVTGATLMGDGSVVLILNPAELISEPLQPETPRWTTPQTPLNAAHKTAAIMVVDDSVSVRRVVSNLVKNAGWQPITAKDGLEALEIIQRAAQAPDLILLDIEMPRMDGYELTTTLRGQEAYRDIPIVMLTSRAGEKHRQKALDVGATEYVVKPYQDEVLVNLIRGLLQKDEKQLIVNGEW